MRSIDILRCTTLTLHVGRGLDDGGLRAVLQVVLKTESDGGLDAQVFELIWSEEADLGRLVAAFQLPTDDAASEANRELLSDLTV